MTPDALADLLAREAPFLPRPPDFSPFLADLRAANRRVNLLSDDGDAFLQGQLLDALRPLAMPGLPESARIIDVGTGGGFPGLPILIARPLWRGVLLDGVRKKVEAITELCRRHAGGRGEALWGRAEALAREAAHRDAHDLAFCRAVGRFTEVLELTLPFLKPGGALLAHRGHEAPSEVAAAGEALEALAGRVEELSPYGLPGLDKRRYIVRVVKTAPTPAAYPRRDGVPAKRPL